MSSKHGTPARIATAAVCVALAATHTRAGAGPRAKAKVASTAPTPWCAPEVSELSERTCWFDGGTPEDGRRTLVVYLHGAYAATPGFQHLQQRALALHAKRHHFSLLLPTAPPSEHGYVWPGSAEKQKGSEPGILAGILASKAELERRAGKPFDETFIVGFSSGAYYASSLAVRSAIDVDGFIVLAGGSSWARPGEAGGAKRAPVFVGVSARDRQTAGHSRAFGGALAALGWPRRIEERNAGHEVDWTFMAHGIAWLRGQSPFARGLRTVSHRQ